jgi:hypothetical protein
MVLDRNGADVLGKKRLSTVRDSYPDDYEWRRIPQRIGDVDSSRFNSGADERGQAAVNGGDAG